MGQKIGSMAVGSIVKVQENGTPQEYYIVQQGIPNTEIYSVTTNGTWLMRKDIVSKQVWGSDTVLTSNTLHLVWLNNTFYNYLNNKVKNMIKQVRIPYYTVTGGVLPNRQWDTLTKENGLLTRIFLLSSSELYGQKYNHNGLFSGIDGVRLSLFSTSDGYQNCIPAQYNGEESSYATRSTHPNTVDQFIVSVRAGSYYPYSDYPGSYAGMRPVFIVNSDANVSNDGILTGDKYINPPTLSAPISAMVGTKINLSWTTSEGATQYILERNTGSGWSSIYTGPNTSFEDTVGSWSTVQYRVAASDGTNKSDYGMSSAITVISADALVISGEDSYLGILKSDVVYSVNTDTGNQITLERKVNDVTIATITVDNGFAYSIPVMDLPSGFGTITLTASVQASSGKVSKTRTWTYNKEALTFPMDADIAAYQHNGRTIYPATIAEAVRTPTVMGGSLDKTLELIAPIIGSSVVAAGTYTGTGQFGPDHPNVIDLGAEALVVTIYGDGKTLVISNTSSGSPGMISGTTCTWYSDISAEEQLNKLDTLYSYVAVMTTK